MASRTGKTDVLDDLLTERESRNDDIQEVKIEKKTTEDKKENKNEKKKQKKKKKDKKGGKRKIVAVLILLILLGLIAGVLYFNPFNIRNKYLSGIIEKIPIINNLVSLDTAEDPNANLSVDELLSQINKLQKELDAKDKEVTALTQKNQLYADQILNLTEIASQQLQFREDKAAFDREIATGDPPAFAAYYEQISPDNAAELYREIAGQLQADREFKKLVRTYEEMDEKDAAQILEEVMVTDMDQVVSIIKSMKEDLGSAVLAAMQRENAAAVSRRLYPETP